MSQKTAYDMLKEAPNGSRVRIIDFIGERQQPDSNVTYWTVEMVNATVKEVDHEAGSILLGVTADLPDMPSKTFFCWFKFEAFLVERYDRHDNRFDVQISNSFVLNEYQDKWISKNLTWSNMK